MVALSYISHAKGKKNHYNPKDKNCIYETYKCRHSSFKYIFTTIIRTNATIMIIIIHYTAYKMTNIIKSSYFITIYVSKLDLETSVYLVKHLIRI